MTTRSKVDRRTFVTSAVAALFAVPLRARATGGLDIGDESAALHRMRVLLATATFAPPQQLDEWHFAWSGRTT